MESTKVILRNSSYGEVQLFSNDEKAGKMTIAVADGKLTVFHTEVRPEFQGHDFAKLLLAQLVNYATENGLKIIPLCPYVNAQFRRHPAQYEDVWSKDWHQ
ncbi:N-acetyltransferase [Mucilaginibacter sp. JRF]|uniref:GNAT family N-acetyltransferase n=1 Tax=Mucilaginibacter sp. JRF TaxID=2780088 RepID=UPI00187F447D|nr:GNAT family N-acetyltransferase [Mucilaginibacter sp. JRF]MBE9586203.1 N-acetyltransferase [Mucilaginibacter sp. JRF]